MIIFPELMFASSLHQSVLRPRSSLVIDICIIVAQVVVATEWCKSLSWSRWILWLFSSHILL